MNQCVPRWDLEDPNPPLPMSDFEVAELTWENGNISSHGLGPPRIIKSMPRYPTAATSPATPISWTKQQLTGAGTLEEVVKEAARTHMLLPVSGVAQLGAVDALVPCTRDEVETCLVMRKRQRLVGEDGMFCASQGSAAPGDDLGFTTATYNSTSLTPLDGGSPDTENASIVGGANDSICHSRRSKRDVVCDDEELMVARKSDIIERASISTKRSRVAAVHNESERKRRDRINQKMQTLQKLVPNSSKTDKASMLDEVIDYLKLLQAQVNMMSTMGTMMMPMAAMPPLQMSMIASMAQMTQMAQMVQMAQMGMGMMNLGQLGHSAGYTGLAAAPLPHPDPTTFVPIAPSCSTSWDASNDGMKQPGGNLMLDPFAAFLACQAGQQPASIEACNRIAAMYQKLYQQNQPPNPDS